jgi:Response regulator containing CheY-like receiver domain and AraC-type DNA-binding domain
MGKCRLMVVDDDAAMRQVLKDFVEMFLDSYEIVAEAANGRDAVQVAAEVDADVILMDIRMPLMDGVQATRKIKQELRLRATVVTFTTYSWSEIRQEALNAGAALHLRKPFDLNTLAETLKKAYELSRRPWGIVAHG